MSGLSTDQIRDLKHSSQLLKSVCNSTLLETLWYTTTKESPLQRTTVLDCTMFDRASSNYTSAVDKYSLLLFKKKLALDVAEERNLCQDLETRVNAVYGKEKNALVILQDGKNSLVFSFFNKLRNAVAHGTFNNIPNVGNIFIGQNSSSLSAMMNFYLCVDDLSKIETLLSEILKFSDKTINEFQSTVYSMFIDLERIDENCYRREDGRFVFFDNEFQFVNKFDKKQSEQLKVYIEAKYSKKTKKCASKPYLMLPCSTQIKLGDIEDTYGICVVPTNKLFEHIL